MIEKISYEKFLERKYFKDLELEKFNKVGRKLGLHYKNGETIELNFNRGPLLYALISKFDPKNMLEFGTGGGFGTMCMAWAMTDNNTNGTIFTVDIYDNKKSWLRAIDWEGEKGIVIEEVSNNEIWSKTMSINWQNKIKPLTGYSGDVMSNNSFPKCDFAYIDGAHFYDGVKHDFLSFLKNSNEKFNILFDDYIDMPSYGVKQFIDKEVSKWFDIELIDTDPEHYLYKKLKTKNEEYGMCLISSDSIKINKEIIIKNNEKFMKNYIRYEKRMKFREKLNKRFPFLRNHKFGLKK